MLRVQQQKVDSFFTKSGLLLKQLTAQKKRVTRPSERVESREHTDWHSRDRTRPGHNLQLGHNCSHIIHSDMQDFSSVYRVLMRIMYSSIQSPLANPALVYPALAQHRSVDGEVRPCPNDFSSLIRSRVRSSHDNPASLIGSAKTQ
jgi:hypothetical protein